MTLTPKQHKPSHFRRFTAYLSTPSISYNEVMNIMTPLFIDSLFNALILVSNTAMISASGASAVSAVSLVDSFAFLAVNFFIAIATGGTVVVSQYLGRNQPNMAGRTTGQAVLSAAAIALTVGVPVFLFTAGCLTMVYGALNESVLSLAVIYLRGSALSFVPFAIAQVVMGVMRGSGNARGALFISAVLNSVSIIGTFITVMIMKMGVQGIVISLITARIMGCAAAILLLVRMRHVIGLKLNHFLAFDVKLQKSILLIGIPTGLEQIFFHGGRMITQRFVVMSGLMHTTSNAIAMSLINLLIAPGSAAMIGIVPLVGRCVGAGALDEARIIAKKICVVCGAMMILLLAPYYLLVPQLVKLYSPTPEVARIAIFLTYIHITFQPTIWVTSFVLPGGLRAAGDVNYASVVALIAMWAVRVTLSYYLAIVHNMGAYGVWWAMVVEWVVRSGFFIVRYRGGKWLTHKVI